MRTRFGAEHLLPVVLTPKVRQPSPCRVASLCADAAVVTDLKPGTVGRKFQVRLPFLGVHALALAGNTEASTIADGIHDLAVSLPLV